MENFTETAITIDYSTRKIYLDTSHQATKTKLHKYKLKPVSKFETIESYELSLDDYSISVQKRRHRKLTPKQRAAAAERLAKARMRKKSS